MNSNRSVKELLDLFQIKNISLLGSDIILKFYDDISVREVMKLCRVNKQFDIACNKEYLWKRKVKNDYGIVKMYGSTWRQTALFLFKADMINLGEEWINGRTYGELFRNGLDSKEDRYIDTLVDEYDVGTKPFSEHITTFEQAKDYVIKAHGGRTRRRSNEVIIDDFNRTHNNILYDRQRFERHLKVMTKSLYIIKTSVKDVRFENKHGSTVLGHFNMYSDLNEDEQQKMRKIVTFVDPILYIMSTILFNNAQSASFNLSS